MASGATSDGSGAALKQVTLKLDDLQLLSGTGSGLAMHVHEEGECSPEDRSLRTFGSPGEARLQVRA